MRTENEYQTQPAQMQSVYPGRIHDGTTQSTGFANEY